MSFCLGSPVARGLLLCLPNIIIHIGFWNAFIYIRPRYLRYRRKQQLEQESAQIRRAQQDERGLIVAGAEAVKKRGSALAHAFSAQLGPAESDDEMDELFAHDVPAEESATEHLASVDTTPSRFSQGTTPSRFSQVAEQILEEKTKETLDQKAHETLEQETPE